MISLIGRSPHAAMKTARRSRSATLPLRSFSSLSVMNASAAMVKECLIRSARSRASAARRSASTTAGSMPRAIWRTPFPGDAPCILQPHRIRAIDADGAPGRCRTRCEPGVQDEADPPGLAAPRRVGILGVADPDAEAGKAGVEHLVALAARCRWKRAKVSVG